jgi:hypothetical protein
MYTNSHASASASASLQARCHVAVKLASAGLAYPGLLEHRRHGSTAARPKCRTTSSKNSVKLPSLEGEHVGFCRILSSSQPYLIQP